MNHVAQTAAKEYAPTTPESKGAATDFITRVEAWANRRHDAQIALRDFVRSNVGEVRGFVSRDPLNMSVFGLMFDKAPGAGFMAVPSMVADDLRQKGVRGNAYFPDVSHPIGKQVMQLMSAVSRVSEQRPLLSGVPGVSSVSIEAGRVVLTRALRDASGDLVVRAASSAVKPNAQIALVEKPVAAQAAVIETSSRAARTMRM